MRLSKHIFNVSNEGLSKIVRHLTMRSSTTESVEVEAVKDRFNVYLTERQLKILDDEERRAVSALNRQLSQQIASLRRRPRLDKKYD